MAKGMVQLGVGSTAGCVLWHSCVCVCGTAGCVWGTAVYVCMAQLGVCGAQLGVGVVQVCGAQLDFGFGVVEVWLIGASSPTSAPNKSSSFPLDWLPGNLLNDNEISQLHLIADNPPPTHTPSPLDIEVE